MRTTAGPSSAAQCVLSGGPYTTASQVRQCQLVCPPPPWPRQATCPTRTEFGPSGWPFGHRQAGGWSTSHPWSALGRQAHIHAIARRRQGSHPTRRPSTTPPRRGRRYTPLGGVGEGQPSRNPESKYLGTGAFRISRLMVAVCDHFLPNIRDGVMGLSTTGHFEDATLQDFVGVVIAVFVGWKVRVGHCECHVWSLPWRRGEQ